ncbi:MAG: HPr family phosphocarrier protein [Eubacterium sp.]|jgi:Phosphotransferase System HPr (HPr) Family|nr:HPr family phosphocarrier protein [Eubacterium sp.]
MVSQKVKIKNPTGLHLRPAGVLCKNAIEYTSVITFKYGGENVANAKSVLSVLGACVKSGDEIELICEGEDEETALREMIALIESGLGE